MIHYYSLLFYYFFIKSVLISTHESFPLFPSLSPGTERQQRVAVYCFRHCPGPNGNNFLNRILPYHDFRKKTKLNPTWEFFIFIFKLETLQTIFFLIWVVVSSHAHGQNSIYSVLNRGKYFHSIGTEDRHICTKNTVCIQRAKQRTCFSKFFIYPTSAFFFSELTSTQVNIRVFMKDT